MNKAELTALSEHDITIPERCLGCQRLGNAATELVQAKLEIKKVIGGIDPEVAASDLRHKRVAQIRQYYTSGPEDLIQKIVGISVDRYMSGRGYTDQLRRSGQRLEELDLTVDTSVNDITRMVSSCPTTGCS